MTALAFLAGVLAGITLTLLVQLARREPQRSATVLNLDAALRRRARDERQLVPLPSPKPPPRSA